jgi:uncharacterized protein (DUF1778 family)
MLAFEAAPSEGTRKARLEQRMSQETKALLDRAAYLQGVNASEFVLSHAVAAARETINRLEGTVITPEDRDAFMRAFDAEPTQALVDIMKLHAEVTTGR